MKVYKYRSNYDRDVISLFLNQLFAPTYDNLNDPFEGLFNDKEDKKILEKFKSLEKAYNELVTMVRETGVYSLCKTPDNEILWSLYSDSHRGFVIEYDLDILLNDFNYNKTVPLAHIVPVHYNDSPQNSMIIKDSYNKFMNLSSIIGTKSLSWKHENEIRLIFEEPGLNTYNFKAVTSIIFGLRASEKEISKVMNLMKGRGLNYFKMRTRADSYQLEIIDIQDEFINAPEYIQNKAPFDKKFISADYISAEYHIHIDCLKDIVLNVCSLPNIITVDSIEIFGELSRPKISIFASTSSKKVPVRFFEFEFLNGDFIQVNKYISN
ncbi:DUF2971 domain-containing protein [Chryseobacterium hispalense]|uniref:DUF2971 domain-containing protein n=1 Tax=Chryseobacterium hispalense TaxID=1453492 RepID=UPI00391B0AC0